MNNKFLELVEKASLKAEPPKFEVGDTVDVHTRILEGEDERIQIFSGTVIARNGAGTREMFTVRRIVSGEGVERKFPLHSPKIAKVEVFSARAAEGNEGNDRFYFTTAPGSTNIDRITDFAHGHDKLVLENGIFHGLSTASLAAAFHPGTHAADADDHIIYNRATGALFFDVDGLGGHAQVEFAVLSNKPLLTAGDFAVI